MTALLDMSNIDQSDIDMVARYMRDGMVSTAASQVGEFERAMADYFGVEDTVATNSGTSALHLALLAAGIGPGDEVIVPALTFVATANAVKHTGAIPIYCDVDKETWLMTVDTVAPYITERTKAIIPVHLYGNVVDVYALQDAFFGVSIIEDAAEALGSRFFGNPAGTMGDFGCFSFNGNKTMTTGGGGLIISRMPRKLGPIRSASIQAKGSLYNKIGFNYRMTGISAALGLSQLRRIFSFVQKKNKINEIYRKELAEVELKPNCCGRTVQPFFQRTKRGAIPCWWMSTITVPPYMIDGFSDRPYSYDALAETREKIFGKIRTFCNRRIFKPLTDRFNANEIYRTSICLPSSTLNTENDILEVCKAIKSAVLV